MTPRWLSSFPTIGKILIGKILPGRGRFFHSIEPNLLFERTKKERKSCEYVAFSALLAIINQPLAR